MVKLFERGEKLYQNYSESQRIHDAFTKDERCFDAFEEQGVVKAKERDGMPSKKGRLRGINGGNMRFTREV